VDEFQDQQKRLTRHYEYSRINNNNGDSKITDKRVYKSKYTYTI